MARNVIIILGVLDGIARPGIGLGPVIKRGGFTTPGRGLEGPPQRGKRSAEGRGYSKYGIANEVVYERCALE